VSAARRGAVDGRRAQLPRKVTRRRPRWRSCLLLKVKRLAREDDVRVTAAFSHLLRVDGIWVRSVRLEPARIVVEVTLRRCHLPALAAAIGLVGARYALVDSVWRHLDLGVWRLVVQRAA